MNRNINNWRSCNNIHQAAGREPIFLTSQIWMNQLEEDIRRQGVEITEINSTDSQSSNENNGNSKQTHPWSSASRSYVEIVEGIEADRQEQRSKSFKNPWSYASRFVNTIDSENRQELLNRNGISENGLHNDSDGSFQFNCETPDTAEIETFHKTCLDILDKISALNFDSSSECCDSNEVRVGDMEDQWNGEDLEEHIYSDIDGEKRTVWIYSFKNRRMLSEDTCELVNIPSHGTILSSNSSENDKELNSTRVSSPIPTTLIPRLDLSLGATLPNVTEVTEPPSLESLPQKHVPIQKPANNWCVDSSKMTESKVTDILNWMALSPRERHPRHYVPIELKTVFEVPQDELQDENADTKEITNPVTIEAKSNEVDKAETNLKVSQMDSQRSSTISKRKYMNNATYLISPVRCENRNPFMTEAVSLINTARSAFGDHKVRSGVTVAQPSLSPKPIENEVYQRKGYLCRKMKSAGDAAAVRNIPFLNLVEWTPSTYTIQSEVVTSKTLLQMCVSCWKCCK